MQKKKCAGQYTVDLINNNIRRNVREDVQTGCTGYLHSSNTNGRKIINNFLIIKLSHVDVMRPSLSLGVQESEGLEEEAVAVLDHFNWGGQAGARCTVRGASYI